jgi:hypothetical protein
MPIADHDSAPSRLTRRAIFGVMLSTAMILAAGACRDQAAGDDPPLPAPDSLATAHEVRASLAGEVAPGAQTYTYRQLYAGMTRAMLQERLVTSAGARAVPCDTVGVRPGEERCASDVRLRPDSAAAHLEVIYASEPRGSPGGAESAREITVTRQLPLDVDGVRLARALADAFERQTSLLDRRDATYGHHEALIRMGTLNGTRQNFIQVEIKTRQGREELTVRMSRAGPPAPQSAAPRPRK